MWAFKKEIYKLTAFSESMFIGCDELTSISGEEGIYIINMQLGTDIGVVSLDYESFGIPDRFQIEWDGNIVADSKYVGDDLTGNPPNTGSFVGTTFNNIPEYEYNGIDMVPTGNTFTFTVQQSDVADGSASEPTQGDGTISFAKTTAQPSQAKIIITAPLGGTAFNVTPNCPETPPTNLITLGEGVKEQIACEVSFFGGGNYYILTTQTFETATVLYTDLQGTTLAPSRWYSNQNVARFWTGTSFNNTIEYTCEVKPINLGFDASVESSACTDFTNNPVIYYIPIDEDFSTATLLFTNSSSSNTATQGFYSDGTIWREWDGLGFTSNGNC